MSKQENKLKDKKKEETSKEAHDKEIKNLDVEMIKPEEIYQTRLGLTLISEGFSVKSNKFLREK